LANYYINQKQYDKAFTIFEEALKKNPEDMMATYQIGKTSALSGQKLDRGEMCLRKYLTYAPKQNEPGHAGANMRLAQIMEKRGKKADAKSLYETALKGDASLKEAKEGLERVSK
jgi:tetratricopeptide (TPR) repeat protein